MAERREIAVVGSGIAGLTCAHHLSATHQVTVFEAASRIGGHTATVDVEVEGCSWAIDTGFIVFNDRTYPRFEALMAGLGVRSLATEMSFSVHDVVSGLEYNGHNLNTLFADRRNLLRPKFWRFVREILRFNGLCKGLLEAGQVPSDTLGAWLDEQGFSTEFGHNYLLPMTGAIWSAGLDEARAMPLPFFVRFFDHHGLLDVRNRPQWYVLEGGSRSYLPGLTAPFASRIHTQCPIRRVQREADGVRLWSDQGQWRFDEVVLACHSDQALAMLANPSDLEREVLGAMPYQANDVALHSDPSVLPRRRRAWASWNYRLGAGESSRAVVSYNMNILQRLPAEAPLFCVSLNQTDSIDPKRLHRVFSYDHPVVNTASVAAQQRRAEICGVDRIHYAGAYWYNGFHEDGVRSALDVVARWAD
jgi:predicted NAD/FAD-binding protein